VDATTANAYARITHDTKRDITWRGLTMPEHAVEIAAQR